MVELDGEGFFEVKSDKEHPFIVSTSKYQVKAVGTSFNVYDYQDSPQFEAALLNGKVEVTTNAKKIIDRNSYPQPACSAMPRSIEGQTD
ncbi:FecR domain-containing protein [Bacteroides fragilis]